MAESIRATAARWRSIQAAQADSAAPKPRIALSASYTVQPLLPYLGCALHDRGLHAEFLVAPYNQIFQSLLDPASCLRGADVALILPRLEELAPEALARLARLEAPAAARAEAQRELRQLLQALQALRREAPTTLLCSTLPPLCSTPLGFLDGGHEASQRALQRELNLQLWRGAAELGVRVFDLDAVVSDYGAARAYDPRMWYLGRSPFAEGFWRHLGEALSRAIAPLFQAPAKVLALDLDGTLWGGVLGEDGPAGIRIGDSGTGAAYRDFQDALLALRRQGVLLVAVSKNDEREALEVLAQHPAMRLKPEHLSGWRIGWQRKSDSLQQLAEELGLSLSSFVFVDDHPAEREEIRQLLPQVRVLDLPADPAGYVAALRAEAALDRATLTEEDQQRADQVAAERSRRRLLEELGAGAPGVEAPLAAYLASLGLRVTLRRAAREDVPRVAQLTQKTNQFNLTTIRRSEAEVEALRAAARWRLYVAEVSDRFGDYGLTGVVLVGDLGDGGAVLDTLLLSCRVLGRGVEAAVLGGVVADLRARGGRRLFGRYVRSARNAPAAGFLEQSGFRTCQEGTRLSALRDSLGSLAPWLIPECSDDTMVLEPLPEMGEKCAHLAFQFVQP